MPQHPFDMSPLPSQVDRAIDATQATYKPLPETTCDHRGICCRAGCPNMYYAEFLGIYRKFVLPMGKDERVDLTLQCLRMYLKPQSVEDTKPCVFLKDNNCSVYASRPLKCRLYGLYPSSLYRRMVSGVASDMGVPEEKLPLCTQCDRVKIKPEYAKEYPTGKIPEHVVAQAEKALRDNDRFLGIPAKMQVSGYGYLTYHDWHIMCELGEKYMELLSRVRTSWTSEKKELLIQDMKKLLSSACGTEL